MPSLASNKLTLFRLQSKKNYLMEKASFNFAFIFLLLAVSTCYGMSVPRMMVELQCEQDGDCPPCKIGRPTCVDGTCTCERAAQAKPATNSHFVVN
ncbi:hypothetical protein K1719_024616 [Acacia pycnantha]|nr:hypothetical protein K1719_046878 [Acacia pycnantha]KAI9099611.1 hypothetical protein K1719_024616 [Acacia pycnantha]